MGGLGSGCNQGACCKISNESIKRLCWKTIFELKRWLSGHQHPLLFFRTPVQFPESMSDSLRLTELQLQGTRCSLPVSTGSCTPLHIPTRRYTHTHTSFKKNLTKTKGWHQSVNQAQPKLMVWNVWFFFCCLQSQLHTMYKSSLYFNPPSAWVSKKTALPKMNEQ